MHTLLQKYAGYCSSGEIKEMQPLPNKLFTFDELQYLFNNGYITEIDNQFIAIEASNLE